MGLVGRQIGGVEEGTFGGATAHEQTRHGMGWVVETAHEGFIE
jgi:hypothetical protein